MHAIKKLKDRTEWLAFAVSIIATFANRFFDLGLTEGDIYAMFGGAGLYGVGRGVAKHGNGDSAG